MEALFSQIEKSQEKYLKFLKDIVNIETPSEDKRSLDEMADFAEAFARGEGFSVSRIPFEKCGDFLLIEHNPGTKKSAFFMAHMDTVHAKGVFGYPPARIEGDRMIGPGVVDCKGGIAVALCAMKALKDCGYPHHLRLLLTSDEEVSNTLGGQKEKDLIRELSAGFAAALNCEVGRERAIVTSRCGILRLKITVRGKSGHAGAAYFESANALWEAAYKIIALQSKSEKNGTTYSCSVISGGSKLNIIPDLCTFHVDVRLRSAEDMEAALEFARSVAENSTVAGTRGELEILSKRPPMEFNGDTKALYDKLCAVIERCNLPPHRAIHTAGGADSAYTQAAGVPSLCALGLCGDDAHTDTEFGRISSLSERAKMLAALVRKLDEDPEQEL